MKGISRRVSAAVNPVSTAATRWWCHSALRRMLTGYGPTARQRRLIRHGTPVIRHETQGNGFAPSAEQRAEQMKARARAIDDLLGRDAARRRNDTGSAGTSAAAHG
jgi:hypothetical protein